MTFGDLIYISVAATDSNHGKAYFLNYRTNKSASFSFAAPVGTHLVGDSVDWIVERTSIGTPALPPLTNFVAEPFTYNSAWNYIATKPTYYYPSTASNGHLTNYAVTMTDAGSPVSRVTLGGFEDLWFFSEGSAR